MRATTSGMRLAIALLALAAGGGSASGLTCEQVFVLAQASVQFRDQGHSLEQVLAGLKSADADSKLSAAELEVLRRAVTLAFMGHASPKQIALECVQSRSAAAP